MTEDDNKKVEKEDYQKKYEEALKEAKDNYNKWLYLYADFENFKKRVIKEKTDLLKYGNELLAKDLVEVIDSMETALEYTKEKNDIKGVQEGLQLTLKQFLTILKKFGITPMESLGKKFDPVFHEAVLEEEKEDHETGTIIQETKKGYLLHDRVLRAAQVVVAKKKG